MLASQKKPRLVLIDKEKAKVTFQQNANLVFKNNLNLKDMKPSEREIEIRKRRSTMHIRPEVFEQNHHKKSYKFSSTVKKTKKTTKFKNLWISKRGTRNFYIMENQDFVLTDEKNKDYRLYSILDGHGKYGKLIAETAANKISSKYSIDQKNVYKENPELNNEKIMKDVIEQTNKYLSESMTKEVANSGCTILTILIRDQKIYCFNVGSSRAVLAIRSGEDSFIALPLSSDQNLRRFDQKFRILQTKAVLEQLKDENGCRVGPERIWKKGQKYPGIYITRSLGMRMSQEIGIICEPEVTCLPIKQNYEFIIACSDGFWQVFSNNNAVEFIGKYWNDQNLEQGIDNLLDEAVRRWDKKLQLMDDISIAVIRIL